MKTNNRILYLDYIRAIACMLVILLHVSSPYFQWNLDSYISGENKTFWIIGNTVDSISRVCVPLFFMLSGYFFFYDKKPKLKNYTKIIFSLLFYSAFSILSYKILHKLLPDVFYYPRIGILNTPASYHLWFFYSLLVIYMLSNIFNANTSMLKQAIVPILIIMVLFNDKLTFITESIFEVKATTLFTVSGDIVYYMIYAVVGAYIRCTNIKSNKLISFSLLLVFIVSTCFTASLTDLESVRRGKIFIEFYSYHSPFVFISAVSLFLFVKSKNETLRENKFISLVSKNSLPIYGFHAIVLFIIVESTKYFLKYTPITTIPIVFVITLFLSLLMSVIVKKIDIYKLLS
ncbi:TPA: acyltransferase family protein [Morganella morganii]|nr:acyltransferase family protein [Morganella morganii]